MDPWTEVTVWPLRPLFTFITIDCNQCIPRQRRCGWHDIVYVHLLSSVLLSNHQISWHWISFSQCTPPNQNSKVLVLLWCVGVLITKSLFVWAMKVTTSTTINLDLDLSSLILFMDDYHIWYFIINLNWIILFGHTFFPNSSVRTHASIWEMSWFGFLKVPQFMAIYFPPNIKGGFWYWFICCCLFW